MSPSAWLRKTLPRSRAAERNIDFVHTQDERIHLSASDATPNPPERQERWRAWDQESGYRSSFLAVALLEAGPSSKPIAIRGFRP